MAMPKMPLAPRDALVQLMILVSAVDRDISDVELRNIGGMVELLPIFGGFSKDRLMETTKSVAADVKKESAEAVLDRIVAAIPAHLLETAYAFACDVAAVDTRLPPSELRFVQIVRAKLGIDRLIAAAIERGAAVRFRTQ